MPTLNQKAPGYYTIPSGSGSVSTSRRGGRSGSRGSSRRRSGSGNGKLLVQQRLWLALGLWLSHFIIQCS